MKTLLLSAVYGASVVLLHAKRNERLRASSKAQMPLKRLMEIARSFEKQRPKSDGRIWSDQRSYNKRLGALEGVVSDYCSKLLFVGKATARSGDDDLARLESSMAAASGFKYLREGRKGKGIQQATIHGPLSNLFLGGRLAEKGESALQTTQILAQQALGARHPDLARCDGNVFAQDRGHQSASATNYFSKIGATPFGAHKRAPTFAFAYDRNPRAHNGQIAAPARGARPDHCARRILEDGSEARALAYRESGARARVRLMQYKDIPELFHVGS